MQGFILHFRSQRTRHPLFLYTFPPICTIVHCPTILSKAWPLHPLNASPLHPPIIWKTGKVEGVFLHHHSPSSMHLFILQSTGSKILEDDKQQYCTIYCTILFCRRHDFKIIRLSVSAPRSVPPGVQTPVLPELGALIKGLASWLRLSVSRQTSRPYYVFQLKAKLI